MSSERALAEHAIAWALERLDAADGLEAQVAAAEAVLWIVALDEHLNGPSRDGVLGGLRYLRNRVAHQLASPLTLAGLVGALGTGRPFGAGLPFGVARRRMTWPTVDELPDPEDYPSGRDAYREHLAGRDVRGTLHLAGQELSSI